MFSSVAYKSARKLIGTLKRCQSTSLLFQEKYKVFLKHVYGKDNHKDEGTITYTMIEDAVGEIVINHPNKCNSISGRMMNDLAKIADKIFNNKMKQPFAVIIRGTGSYFCSGADLSLSTHELNTPEWGVEMSTFMTDFLNSFRTSDIISVCILNGPALGGGAELATSCDFRIMCNSIITNKAAGITSATPTTSTTTTTNSNYIRFVHASIGASPGWGGATRLYSIVGRQHALRFLGSSEKIFPYMALKSGLVDEVFDITCNDDNVTSTSSSTTIKATSSVKSIDDIPTADTIMRRHGLKFLQPFLNQPYKHVVSQIKSIIATAESDSVEVTNDSSINTINSSTVHTAPLSAMRLRERTVFSRSWASSDNKKEIAEFMSTHHHHNK